MYVLGRERAAGKMLLWLLVFGPALVARVDGFYLPGLAPVSFCESGDNKVPDCKVNTKQHDTAGLCCVLSRCRLAIIPINNSTNAYDAKFKS